MISIITGEKNKISTKEKGITLIALVVTIIVLLILAGVSIQMLSGQNGILKRAKESKEKTKIAELKENIELEIMDELVENSTGSIDKNKLREILVKYFGEEKVPAVNDTKWDKFPEGFIFKTEEGYEIDIAEIYDESLGKMAAGEETIVPEGKEWEDTVTPVTDGEGNIIPVPKGFRYLEGTKDTGFVITDEEGNEFVWVPCTVEKYEKHNYISENNDDYDKNVADTTGGWNTWNYRMYTDWKEEADLEKNKLSIKKYEGFYIARYEAGVPSNADFYVSVETVEQKEYAETKNDINGLKPVSKKGAQAWNLITQENAVIVSENMYKDISDYGVTSKLVDGYAWDRIVNWIESSNKYGNIAENSKTYGNYADNDDGKLIITNSSLYAEHLMKTNVTNPHDEGWCLPNHYKYGTFTTGYQFNWDGSIVDYRNTEDDMQYYHYLEMSTGASDKTKLNNIYDLAGNVSEYTTECGYHGESSETGTKYAVLRGGNFWDLSQGVPISYRDANVTSKTTHPRFGFRVVLYIK